MPTSASARIIVLPLTLALSSAASSVGTSGGIHFSRAVDARYASRSGRKRWAFPFRNSQLRIRGGGGVGDDNGSEDAGDEGTVVAHEAYASSEYYEEDSPVTESTEPLKGEYNIPVSPKEKKNRVPYSLSGIVRNGSDDEEVKLPGDESKKTNSDGLDDGREYVVGEAEQVAGSSVGATDNDEWSSIDSSPSPSGGEKGIGGASNVQVTQCEENRSALCDGGVEQATGASGDCSDDDAVVRRQRPRQSLLADGVRRILFLVGRDDSPLTSQEQCRNYDEVFKLKTGIVQRCESYLEDVFPDAAESEEPASMAPHPRKVLHHVAPRIPAIRQTRDITLRITSARADVDAGAAARSIGAVAALAEMYDRIVPTRSKDVDGTDEEAAPSASDSIVSDRRFEQLVECILCGLDLKRSAKMELSMLDDDSEEPGELSGDNSEPDASAEEEIELGSIDLSNNNDASELGCVEDGDSCTGTRMTMTDISVAAWGLSVLGLNQSNKVGGQKVRDIFIALCIASADLLAYRLNALHRGYAGTPLISEDGTGDDPTGRTQSAMLLQEMSNLASDSALALWAFACSRACTGLTSPCWDYHVNVCCAVLSAEQRALLEARESMLPEDDIVIERLERAEVEEAPVETKAYINIDSVLNEKQDLLLTQDEEHLSPSDNTTASSEAGSLVASDMPISIEMDRSNTVDSDKIQDKKETEDDRVGCSSEAQTKSTLLLEKIAPNEVANVLWALALPGLGRDARGSSSVSVVPIELSSPEKQEVIQSLVDRISDTLRLEIEALWRLKAAAATKPTELRKGDETDNHVTHDDIISDQDGGFAGKCDSSNSTNAGQKQINIGGSLDADDSNPVDPDCLGEKSHGPHTAAEDKNSEMNEEDFDVNGDDLIEILQDGDEMVEVIDASRLLNQERDDREVNISGDESIILTAGANDRSESNIEEVEMLQEGQGKQDVIDVSKISAEIDAAGGEGGQTEEIASPDSKDHVVEGAICSDSTSPQGIGGDDCFDSDIPDENTEKTQSSNIASSPHPTERISRDLNFSPSLVLRDLSSIVWALTEMRHPSRSEFLALVAVFASLLGRDAVMELGGGTLSNLAWAFAKDLELSDEGAAKSVDMPPSLPRVIQWIAESCLGHLYVDSNTGRNGFGGFEPPELSRLMWSLSMITTSTNSFSIENHHDFLGELACTIAELARTHVSEFTAEDLARIVWAYTECCPTGSPRKSFELFGILTSTIESSLLRWENGHCSVESSKGDETTHESVNNTPMFGRSRLSLPFLDLLVSHDDEDGDESSSIRYYRQQQGSLPNLRDLTVDPSTLCKVAYGLSAIRAEKACGSSQTLGGMTCLRIATRLFASKQGRLLRECNTKDIVRLCCACANTLGAAGFSTVDQEFVFRHFPRRVVQLLNENEDLLGQLPASKLADLIWPLGELGVQESRETRNRQMEYKRLRLVARLPALSESQFADLPPSCTANLLCGLCMMGCNGAGLIRVLKYFPEKIPLLPPSDLRRSLLCLTRLARTIIWTESSESKDQATNSASTLSTPSTEEVNFDANDTKAGDGEQHGQGMKCASKHPDIIKDCDKDDVVSSFQEKEAEAEIVIESLSPDDQANRREISEVRNRVKDLIHLIAVEMEAKLSQLSSFEICQMLEALVLVPYQADVLIDAVESEIETRLSTLQAADAIHDTRSIETRLRNATDSTVEAAAMLSTVICTEGKPGSNLFKKGLKALVDRASKENENDSELVEIEPGTLAPMAEHVSSAAASLCEVMARIERVDKGANISVDDMLRSAEGSTIAELAQCQEWIAGYRRLNFDTNTRTSRLDKTRRKNMGKRILSRLFQ